VIDTEGLVWWLFLFIALVIIFFATLANGGRPLGIP
jgi:hypothetical protein